MIALTITRRGNAQRMSKSQVEEFIFTAIGRIGNSATLERFPNKVFRNGCRGRIHVLTSCRVAILSFTSAVLCMVSSTDHWSRTSRLKTAFQHTSMGWQMLVQPPKNKPDVRILGSNELLGCFHRVNCDACIRHVNIYEKKCSCILEMLKKVLV